MGSRRRISRPCNPLLCSACARGNGAWLHTILSTNLIHPRLLWTPLTGSVYMQGDVRHPYCMIEGCRIKATFRYPGRKLERCKAHALDGMVRTNSHTKSAQASHPVFACC